MLNRWRKMPLREKAVWWVSVCLVCASGGGLWSAYRWAGIERDEYRENLEIGHGVTTLLRERNKLDRDLAAARAKVEYDLHHDDYGGAR